MKKDELDKILPYFIMYSDRDYSNFYLSDSTPAKWYYHKGSEFPIIIFENGEVYQVGTEADTIGIELVTYEKFIERYESFTGEKIEEYDRSLDEVYEEIDRHKNNQKN